MPLVHFFETSFGRTTERHMVLVEAVGEGVSDVAPGSRVAYTGQPGSYAEKSLVQADRLRRRVAMEMARIFTEVDILLVPSLRDEMLTLSNFTGDPSLTLRAGFVNVSEARSDWAPDPKHPLPRFSPPRRVPHGVTLVGETNLPALVAADASALYASNVLDFLKLVLTKEGTFEVPMDDDIVVACLMTQDGPVKRA